MLWICGILPFLVLRCRLLSKCDICIAFVNEFFCDEAAYGTPVDTCSAVLGSVVLGFALLGPVVLDVVLLCPAVLSPACYGQWLDQGQQAQEGRAAYPYRGKHPPAGARPRQRDGRKGNGKRQDVACQGRTVTPPSWEDTEASQTPQLFTAGVTSTGVPLLRAPQRLPQSQWSKPRFQT